MIELVIFICIIVIAGCYFLAKHTPTDEFLFSLELKNKPTKKPKVNGILAFSDEEFDKYVERRLKE